MNHVRKAFRPVFGHDGEMPLGEFQEAVHYIASQYARYWPHAPKYPSLVVAQTSQFHWSPEKYEDMKRQLWSRYVQQLALKHLSQEDYRTWIESKR